MKQDSVMQYTWRAAGGIARHINDLCAQIPGTCAVSEPKTARRFNWISAGPIRAALVARKFRVVHAHGIKAAAWMCLWHPRVITSVHTVVPITRLSRLTLALIAARSRSIYAVSTGAKTRLSELGVDADLAPNASSLADELRKTKPLTQSERKQLAQNLGLEAPLVLTIGRFSPEKDLPLAAEVSSQLRGRGISHTHLILGAAHADEATRAAYPHSIWMEASDQVGQYLRAASVLLITSKSETTAFVVTEALSAATPVVGLNAGDIPTHLAGGGGILIEQQQDRAQMAGKLTDGLEQVLKNWQHYSDNARASAANLTDTASVSRFWARRYAREIRGK